MWNDSEITRADASTNFVLRRYALDRGFKGVYTAWIAVVAVLKVQFAQMIALGAAIGDFLGQLLRVPATQIMVHLMSKETHKWIPTYINYSCKAIAVAVASRPRRPRLIRSRSRRRRGHDADRPWTGRGDAAATTRIVRGRIVATPR